MLIQTDNRWVLCCPPKTGSTRLLRLAHNSGFCQIGGHTHGPVHKERETDLDWQIINRCHTRIMLVRHPLDRLVSLFWYIVHRKANPELIEWIGDEQFMSKAKSKPKIAFSDFCEFLIGNQEATYTFRPFLRTLDNYHNLFKPDILLPLELGYLHWLKQNDTKGLKLVARYNQTGSNKGDRKSIEKTVGLLTKNTKTMITDEVHCLNSHFIKDKSSFRYEVKK